MNKLDLLILLPMAVGFVFGIFKGLIKEVTSFAAILLGIYGAKLLAPVASSILVGTFHFSPVTATPLSYLILFIAIAVGLLILAKSIEKMFDSMALGGLNKFLGGLFGALKYGLIVSVLLIVINAIDTRFSFIRADTKNNSFLYQPMLKLAPTLWDESKQHYKN
jgi:membrane protein required for colicin V production